MSESETIRNGHAVRLHSDNKIFRLAERLRPFGWHNDEHTR